MEGVHMDAASALRTIMKSSILFGSCFGLAALLLTSSVQGQDYEYWTHDGAITITRYNGPGGNVIIPDTINGLPVTLIGSSAFSGCTALLSVSLPESLVGIYGMAFSGCSALASIQVDPANAWYASLDGVLFDKSQSVLLLCPPGRAGAYAIPDSVTNICVGAFLSCARLTSVSIPKDVTWIATLRSGDDIPQIGPYAFYGCSSLVAINVDLANPAYSSLDGVLFDKSRTTLLQCPAGKAGDYAIPDGVGEIRKYALSGCTKLTSISIPDTVARISAFPQDSWAAPWDGWAHGAFHGCTGLTSITLPGSVTSIGYGAFYGCTNLVTITVDAGNPRYRSLDGVLFDKPSAALVEFPAGKSGPYAVPDDVASIAWGAFYRCLNLTSLSIPAGLTNIALSGYYPAFLEGCTALSAILVDAENPVFSAADCVLFDRSQTTLLRSAPSKAGSYTIPVTVSSIGTGAFHGCASLTSIIMPETLTNIGHAAFSFCQNLSALYFEGNAPTVPSGYIGLESATNAVVYFLPSAARWGPTIENRPTALWRPKLLAERTCLPAQADPFCFSVLWARGRTVVVEAAASFAHSSWFPMATNSILADGSCRFIDFDSPNQPARFYRVRWP